MPNDLSKETFEAIVQLGRTTGEPKIIKEGTIPFAVIPTDAKVQSLAEYVFNEHAAHPERIKTTVSVHDPESFIEYYKEFADSDSRAFANEPKIEIVAVLDYHEPTSLVAHWCQHRVTLVLRQSEQWRTWAGKNNCKFTQMEFAEFLEQNAIDISTPDPAAMLEVARDLQATTEVEFGAGSRTQDGQIRFKYSETIKATIGAGQLAVPEQFVISIPAFIGGASVSMQALLRFRIKESKLVIWYTLIRPEEVIRMAFLEARNHIAEALKITVINGTV